VFVTLAVLVAIFLLGLWIVRLGLRPLAAIGRTADVITAGDLSHRVERAEPRTEVGRLGLALNTMLDRIESSDRRLRRFVADASHELRTPLAAVSAYAELFQRGADKRPDDLARGDDGDQPRERADERSSSRTCCCSRGSTRARRSSARPSTWTSSPPRRSRPHGRSTRRGPLDLSVEPAVGARRPREPPPRARQPARQRPLAHTPPETPAHVRISSVNGSAVLEVADEGPGLPDGELGRVFHRFYRADSSRSRESGGVGLGLSIVAAIAEAHDGTVSAAEAPGGGAVFRVELPLARHGSE